MRVAGKRGRLPAKRLDMGFLHDYAALPEPTYPVDATGGITSWGMLGNGPDPSCTVKPEGVGDCIWAGRQHYKMAKVARAQTVETWETSNQLVEEYLKYNHGVDQGGAISDVLYSWYQAGKILAFAPVDHTNAAAVDSALQAFTGVLCGVALTDDAEQLFEAKQPWTVTDGEQPDSSDGHCIIKIAAKGNGGNDGWVTWAADQQSTPQWTQACLEEAWVIISAEDAKRVDLTALRADIDALGGTESDAA